MKRSIRLLSMLMSMVFLLSCFIIPSVAEDGTSQQTQNGEDARFTQKIVSVLYDNSGSMSDTDNREHYGEYALRMLASLLSNNDILIITPMNDENGNTVTSTDAGITVKLNSDDRQGAVKEAFDIGFYKPVVGGSTPGDSIGIAVDQLEKYGLKDSANLAFSPENVEHWLVLITDGGFSGNVGSDYQKEGYASYYSSLKAEGSVKIHTEDFPSLKTIFLGLGDSSPQISDFGTLMQTTAFTPYRANSATGIIDAMQDVANQLSGRYTLDKKYYSVSSDGRTVEIDLDKVNCSFKSLSVIVQNCGATLESATYKDGNLVISQPCVITPNTALSMQDGYSATLSYSDYISGGKITLRFSKAVKKENISILAEPALEIRSYFEYNNGISWVHTDMQYINANLSKGDKIRVGYDVYELANNTLINIKDIFGEVKANVTYANTSYEFADDGTPPEIPLVVGNNAVRISVSVMDGAYKLDSSSICIIEEDPTSYRIEAECEKEISTIDKYTDIYYSVYVGGKLTSKSKLEADQYTITVTAKTPNGSNAKYDISSESDGRIRVRLKATDGVYGSYTVKFEVKSVYGISRVHTSEFEYRQGTMTIDCEAPSKLENAQLSEKLTYTVKVGDAPLSKKDVESAESMIAVLTDPDGNEKTLSLTVGSDGRITTNASVQKRLYGNYSVKFTFTKSGLTESYIHDFSYLPYSVEIVKGNCDSVVISGASSVNAEFVVVIDGEQIKSSDFENYAWMLTATAPGGVVTQIDSEIASDGTVKAELKIPAQKYGEYVIKMTFAVTSEMKAEVTHSVKYNITTLDVKTVGEGRFSASQYQMNNNENKLQFELFCDGNVPLVFDNGLTSHKVTVGGVDVTDYVILDGNVLTYVPKSEHFGGEIPVGTKNVEINVTTSDLKASANASFDVTNIVYEIIALNCGNRNVDRFRLTEVDASIHYQVLRDGEPLSVEELQKALDSGELLIKDEKGTFGWKVWLPCGNTVSVEDLNGQPAVTFRVTRDIFKPVDSYLAMLIFNGDKGITASYKGASLTENITFDKSPVWSYIWRILVIMFIIHVILYIIGFFNGKCKSLPTGVFVLAQPSRLNPSKKEVFKADEEINIAFSKKYSWHIVRFIPIVYMFVGKCLIPWYNQPAKKLAVGNFDFVFKYNKHGAPVIIFDDTSIWKLTFAPSTASIEGRAARAYMDLLRQYDYTKESAPKMDEVRQLTATTMRNMFRNPNTPVNEGAENDFTVCVGKFSGGRDRKLLTSVMFFIQHN